MIVLWILIGLACIAVITKFFDQLVEGIAWIGISLLVLAVLAIALGLLLHFAFNFQQVLEFLWICLISILVIGVPTAAILLLLNAYNHLGTRVHDLSGIGVVAAMCLAILGAIVPSPVAGFFGSLLIFIIPLSCVFSPYLLSRCAERFVIPRPDRSKPGETSLQA